jgi:hypothetical protein
MYVDQSLRFSDEHPKPHEGLTRRLLFAQVDTALAGKCPAPVVNDRQLSVVDMLLVAAYARAHGFLPPV